MSQAATDELHRRRVSLAAKIIELVGHLPKTSAGRRISGQILRSGTSPAPNCGEARGAESRARLCFGREKKSMIMNIRMLHWERRRPAGIALGINSAVIIYPCRRDAGAPGGNLLAKLRPSPQSRNACQFRRRSILISTAMRE
jgi:hypothetical protein